MYDNESKLIRKARKRILKASDLLVTVNEHCWESSDDVADDFVHPEVINDFRALLTGMTQTLHELEATSHDYV